MKHWKFLNSGKKKKTKHFIDSCIIPQQYNHTTEDNISFRALNSADLDALLFYLHHLGNDTRKRFGPHAFDRDAVIHFFDNPAVKAYVAEDLASKKIIAYFLIKKGLLAHEYPRLAGYGYAGIENNSCTFAPSVADEWQSKGIGKQLFYYTVQELKKEAIDKIILWGGVQAGNNTAVNFYRRAGFIELGRFEYNGPNIDMLLDIDNTGQTLKRD